MTDAGGLLFVYGSLRPGAPPHPLAERFWAEAAHLGRARTVGALHWITDSEGAAYPGLVESGDAADIVIGDLFRLPEAPALLALLDAYEDEGVDYLRRTAAVTLEDGRTLMAWVYVRHAAAKRGARIAGGDFLKAQAQG
ncbi:MAG: gamma-glutamylcyclotransferase [Hyphomonadaceae bacterium]